MHVPMDRIIKERGNSVITALLVIMVIAVVALAVWYVTKIETLEDAENNNGLEINLGSTDSQ
jgi:type II secretory pathway component PulK